MQVEILYRPSYSVARVSLERKEKFQVEAGAMLGMSPDIEMETQAKGGLLKSMSRSMFGGESFFMNSYTGAKDGDRILTEGAAPETNPDRHPGRDGSPRGRESTGGGTARHRARLQAFHLSKHALQESRRSASLLWRAA